MGRDNMENLGIGRDSGNGKGGGHWGRGSRGVREGNNIRPREIYHGVLSNG